MPRILLADDHAAVRKGVRETLEEDPAMKVIGEAGTVEQAIKLLSKERVDLLVMDISMPGRTGLDSLAEIKGRWPRLAVLIYTMHSEAELALRALKAGASGYLTKDCPLSELVEAVKRLSQGSRYVAPATNANLLDLLAGGASAAHESLSGRELTVMRMIAEGKSLKEIARQLSLSAKTISTYRTRILEKMGFKSNADLTRYLVSKGGML